MQTPIYASKRFEVGYGSRIGLKYRKANGVTLTMLIDADEAETVGNALITAARKMKAKASKP